MTSVLVVVLDNLISVVHIKHQEKLAIVKG